MSSSSVSMPKSHVAVSDYCLQDSKRGHSIHEPECASDRIPATNHGVGGVSSEEFRREGDIIFYRRAVSGYHPLPSIPQDIARIHAGVLHTRGLVTTHCVSLNAILTELIITILLRKERYYDRQKRRGNRLIYLVVERIIKNVDALNNIACAVLKRPRPTRFRWSVRWDFYCGSPKLL